MTKYAIRIVDGPGAGTYVQAYDPAFNDGEGLVDGTEDLGRALLFNTIADATAFYFQDHGMRPDGQPNRPLTASTVEITPIP